ncbi:MAG TPA: hypothetical protein PK915_00795 [Bacteroidales bacterium]|nr:hypothetical protein [Bacteroidales bacterium]
MKTKFLLMFAALFGVFLFNSCDEDLLDITETFTYETEMVILSDDLTFSKTEDVDMTASEDLIEKYGEKIKDIEIEEVTYWLTAFNGSEEQKIIESSLVVADENGADPKNIVTINDVLLQPLMNNETELTVNVEGIDRLSSLMETPPHKLQLIFNTTTNEAPLDFTVKFKFKVKMTANPLE